MGTHKVGATVAPALQHQPQVGMLATVRNRRGVVSGVRPHDGPDGRLHLVDIEYNDGESPFRESLLWEREPEPARKVIPATDLPRVGMTEPMDPQDLLAVVRACRWSAAMPFVDPDGAGPLDRLPVSAPFHGAIQVEDFQLVPLLKALRMPRVSLLIADDVGLGKTIEAGLILSELLLRRRIRKVLVMTPASLRLQWRDELEEKFALPFEVVDRDSTAALRRQFGMDANPWRMHSRVITSYHYLKQPDVLEEFRAASHGEREAARLPWDLLIVDEAHNLAPVPMGDESELTKMLRRTAPLFEHRLFLTATPHNGHTRSFTGLLEMLDPVRFSQTHELKAKERERVPDVLIRRLKREINERTDPPLFCDRLPPKAIELQLSAPERRLGAAFDALRSKIRSLLATAGKNRRHAGSFAVEILGKRLLSCPVAFADSWWRSRQGLAQEDEVTDGEVLAARRSVAEETADDREAESRARAASSAVGAWLRPLAGDLEEQMDVIGEALDELGLGASAGPPTEVDPTDDSRYTALRALIEERLQANGAWRDDERLIVFTEYKTTLDYLVRRLSTDYLEERSLSLFGGMTDAEREGIKQAFNDPDHPVRILVATDAASEGLNLQETARYLLHWDIPWNPARLEQRNGRLDRHGQPRDVHTWHFASEQDHDLRFLSHVAGKVHTIREDLGATGEVLDRLVQRRLIEGDAVERVQSDLEAAIDAVRESALVPRDSRSSTADDGREAREAGARLDALAKELDLAPSTVVDTLDAALGTKSERPRLEAVAEDPGRYRLLHPYPPAWQDLIDETLRLTSPAGGTGAVRALAFDPRTFIKKVCDRPVFKPRKDTALVHLRHPLLHRAVLSLARRRFPGGDEVSRWTVRTGTVPEGADALLEVTVEELAVNELRETFHHWTRTLRFPVTDNSLGAPLPHLPAAELHGANGSPTAAGRAREQAEELWDAVVDDVTAALEEHGRRLTAEVAAQLDSDREEELRREDERYRSRHGEVSALIESNTLKSLEREITELREKGRQLHLGYEAYKAEEIERDIELRKEELRRRKQHYEEVREELAAERKRVLEELIPRRYALRDDVQVLPVAVEIVLPEDAS